MGRPKRLRVGIVAIPDAGLATLSGVFDVLNSLALLAGRDGVPDQPPFEVELLGETPDPVRLASRVTLPLHGAAQGRPPLGAAACVASLKLIDALGLVENAGITGAYPNAQIRPRWAIIPMSGRFAARGCSAPWNW